MGKTLGNVSIKNINVVLCNEVYDTWEAETSTSNANHCSRIFSVLMNYLVSMDYIPYNPMARVKKRTSTPRSVVWTHDQVMNFLDAAFTKFEWRNIGLIVLMCYEWGQRPVDIRNLQWDSVDLEERKVTIHQSKRGATVELPVPDGVPTIRSTSPQATGQGLQAANSVTDDQPAWTSKGFCGAS
jgi:integrase